MKMNKYQYVCENYKKPKPILFNTEMVRAILEGRKTQTRRPIKGYGNNYHVNKLLGEWALSEEPEIVKIKKKDWLPRKFNKDKFILRWILQTEVDDCLRFDIKLPYQPGDILYVRETFYPCKHVIIDREQQYLYRATFEQPEKYPDFKPKWKPSIHMPKEAARIFLRVTNVRVERLQDLLAIDVQKEGFEERGEFEDSWDDTYLEKGYGWDKNPWVWVIKFERVRENDD